MDYKNNIYSKNRINFLKKLSLFWKSPFRGLYSPWGVILNMEYFIPGVPRDRFDWGAIACEAVTGFGKVTHVGQSSRFLFPDTGKIRWKCRLEGTFDFEIGAWEAIVITWTDYNRLGVGLNLWKQFTNLFELEAVCFFTKERAFVHFDKVWKGGNRVDRFHRQQIFSRARCFAG